VVTHYPRQTFELYAYVKSGIIKNVLVTAWDSLLRLSSARVPKTLFGIIAAQGLVFIAFVLALTAVGRPILDRRMLIFPAFFVASLSPLYVAWAVFWTSTDTICLFYCCIVLGILLLAQLAAKAITVGVPTAPSDRNPLPAVDARLTPRSLPIDASSPPARRSR
jgi:hypothetical protein